MSIKASRIYGFGLAILAVSAFAACSSDDPGTSTTAGTGNSTAGTGSSTAGTGTGGTSSTAGTGNSTAGSGTSGSGTSGSSTGGSGGSGGGTGNACKGTKPTSSLITGFEDAIADTMNAGQFKFTLGVPGGTYAYPAADLTASVADKTLNIKGNVKDYSGFGIYLNDCTDAAGAGATGVSFNIKGNVGMGGMLSFRIETNSTTPALGGKGTCPAGAMWEVCHPGEFAIPVTAGGAEVMVTWDKLMGGVPVATVDGKDVVGFQWAFTWATGATAYDVDVTVDDIKFMGTIMGGGGTGAGGSGGGGAGGGGAGGGGAGGGGAGGGGAGGGGGGAGGGGAGGTAGGGAGGTQP